MAGDYIDETHQAIAEFAESFLEEDERDSFIDGLMERHGYQRMSHWAPPEPAPAQQGGRAPLLGSKPKSGGRGQQPAPQAPQGGARSYFKQAGGR